MAGTQLGGTGKDADKGKERTQFEKDRQGRMQGSGGDRPPVYKPKDDGERGGYKNRITRKVPAPRASNANKLAVNKMNSMIDNGHHQYTPSGGIGY